MADIQTIKREENNTETTLENQGVSLAEQYRNSLIDPAKQKAAERQENIKRYGIELPDDVYSALNESISTSENPEETAYNFGTAYRYSQAMGISFNEAYNQMEDLNAALWNDGKSRDAKGKFEAVSDMVRMGNNNVKLGNLGHEILKAERTNDTEMLDILNKQVEALYKDNELCYDNTPRSWLMQALEMGAQSLPYTGYSAGAGMIGNFIIPGSGTAAAFATSAYLTQGQEYLEMRAQGVRPEIARKVSLVDGAIQGGVEACLGEVAGYIGSGAAVAGKKVLGDTIRTSAIDKVSGALAKKFHFSPGKKLLVNWGVRYLEGITEEGAEEVVQQFTGDVSKNVAIGLENSKRQEELQAALDQVREDLTPTLEAEIRKEYPSIEPMKLNEIVKDSMDQFIGGVAGAVVLGIGPTAIRAPVDIKNYLAVKDAAQSIESEEAFKKYVKEDPQAKSVFENIAEDQRENIITEVWKDGQNAADLQKKEDIKESKDLGDNAESSPVDESGERTEKAAAYRTKSGEIYTEYDTSYGESKNGKTTGRYMTGDPTRAHSLEEGGNRYGYIDYTVEGDTLTIDNFRMTPGREALSGEFFAKFAEDNAGMDIKWNPKFESNTALKDELIKANPRGEAQGLNYFASGEDVHENKTYIKLARQLKENAPNLSNEQIAAEIGIIRAASRAQGLSTEDFVNNTFENGQLVTNQATQGVIEGERALNQGKTEENRVTVLGATELQRSGKSILYVAKNGDFNTLVHETGHVLENYLTEDEKQTVLSQFGGKDGKWDVSTSEKFADALVDYLRTGTTNNKGMENIFKKAAQFIADIFRGFQGRVELSPEIKEVFDSLLQDDGSGFARAMYAVNENTKRTEGKENYNKRVEAEKNNQVTEEEVNDNVRENEQSQTEVTSEKAQTKEEVTQSVDKTINEVDSTTEEKSHEVINESSVENADNYTPYDLFQIISEKSLPVIRKEAINKQLTSDLEKAKAMMKNQEWQFKDKSDLMRRIKRATGWEIFNDKWVHEFDERAYDIDTKFINGLLSLTPEQLQYAQSNGMFEKKSALIDIIPNAELYEYFPGLKNVSVQFINNASYKWRGATDGRGITFNLANIKSAEGVLGFRGVLTHEVQHIIQGLEGDSPFHRQALVGKAVAYDIGSFDDKINEVNSEYEARYIQQRVEEINREILLTDKTENKTLFQTLNAMKAAEKASQEKDVRELYENTKDWMKAPNGKDTHLSEKQWLQVRTPNFKNWFGDWENDKANSSIVVDENGEPLVVYHGTVRYGKKFDSFKTEKPAWFTPSKEYAQQYYSDKKFYQKGDIYPVFLNIRNAQNMGSIDIGGSFVFDDISERTGIPVETLKEQNFENTSWMWQITNDEKFKKLLPGKDGIEAEELGVKTYAVFNSNQIKSATDNNGDFLNEISNIKYQSIDLSQEVEKATKGEINEENIKAYINSLIGQIIDTQSEPLKIKITGGKNRKHIINSNKKQSKTQKPRHDAALSTLELLINNSYQAGPIEAPNLSHNTNPQTLYKKSKVDKVLKFYSPIKINDVDYYVILTTQRLKNEDPYIVLLYNVDIKRGAIPYAPINLGTLTRSSSADNISQNVIKSNADNKTLFQTAYHGTVADFNQFSNAHVNEGEGSQNFGWGMYFTESEDIARDYAERQVVAKYNGDLEGRIESAQQQIKDLKSKLTDYDSWKSARDEDIKRREDALKNEYSVWKDNLLKRIKAQDPEEVFKRENESLLNSIKDEEENLISLEKELEEAKKIRDDLKRNLYTVELPDDNYLTWEKIINKTQKDKIQGALYNRLIKEDYKGAEKELSQELNQLFSQPMTGENIYSSVSSYLGSDKEASLFFASKGIIGVNYPAGTNFGTPDGKEYRNFVIFDEQDITLKDHILFQTDEELIADALSYDSWEDFRDSYVYYFGPELEDETFHDKVPSDADNAWYKNTWERAHQIEEKNTYNDEYVEEVRGSTEEEESLKDKQWYDMISEEGKLDDFLRAIAQETLNWEEFTPQDQEELNMLNRREGLKSRFNKELRHGFWATAALSARQTKPGEEVKLTSKQRKTLMTLMRNSKRDYRDLYADFMNDSEWAVTEGYTVSDKLRARLQSPDAEFELKTPELRRAIAERLDFEDLKEELKDGSMAMELDTVQKLADGYETEINTLKDKIEALKNLQEETAFLGLKKEAQLEKLNEQLKEKQKQREYLNNIRDIKIRLIKDVNRKVDFKNIDYESGRKVIAIQALFQPKLLKFVNQFLNSEGQYIRDAYSKYRTDFQYRSKLKNIADASGSINAKKVIKLFEIKSFDKWTEDEMQLVAATLPRTDWINELNLDEILKKREGSLQLDFQSKEVQDLLKDILPENLYAKLSQQDVKKWTLEDMEDLVNVVNEIRLQGQMELRAREELRLTRAQEARLKIEKALKSKGIVINDDDTPEEKKRKQAAIDKFKKEELPKILGTTSAIKGTLAHAAEKRRSKLSRLLHGYSDANVRRVARILDNGKDGINTTLLYLREDECFNAEQIAITERTRNITMAMQDNNIELDELFNKVRVNFADGSQEFTVDELMYFMAALDDDQSAQAVTYGNMYDETVKAQFRESGDVEGYMKIAEARMDKVKAAAEELFLREPKFKSFMEAIEKDYGSQYERMNKVSIAEFNSPVWRVEHYVPLNRLESSGDTNANRVKQDLLGMSGAAGSNWVDKGMTKKRIDISPVNQKPVQTGLYTTWADSLNRTEHFLAYAGYVRELNRVYKNRDSGRLRQYMENRYGKAMTEYIDDYINEVANPESAQAQTDLDRFAHILRGKTAPAYLAWKMSGVIKQLCTSPWPYLQYMSPLEYAASCFDIIKSRGQIEEAIKSKSAFMNSRKFDPIADLIDEQRDKAANPLSHALNSFEALGMQGLEWADWACVAPGWLTAYRKEYARLSSEEEQNKRVKAKRAELEKFRDVQGEEWIEDHALAARLTEGDIETLAVRRADDIVRMTQPSNRVTDLSPMFKQRGPGSEISRIFLQFTTSLNVIWQNIRYDLPAAVREKQAKMIVGMVAGYMMAGIMMGLVTEGDGTDDDDTEEEKKEKRARQIAYYSMTQFTDSVPLIGSVVSAGVKQAVTGEKNYSQGFSDMFPIVTKSSTGIMQVQKGDYDKAFHNFMQAAGLSLGLPVSGIKEAEALTGIGDGDGDMSFYPQALVGRRPEKKK